MKKMFVLLLLASASGIFANPLPMPTYINEVQTRPISCFEVHVHPHIYSMYPIGFDNCTVTYSVSKQLIENFTLVDESTHVVISDSQVESNCFVLISVADSIILKNGYDEFLDMVKWPEDFIGPDSGLSAARFYDSDTSYWSTNCSPTFGHHNGGEEPWAGVEGRVDSSKPEAFFFEVYPNPASSQVVLSFMVAKGQSYDLKVFDLAGRLVEKIEEGIGEGRYITAIWMGTNMEGRMVSAGTYFVVLHSEDRKTSRKITRFK